MKKILAVILVTVMMVMLAVPVMALDFTANKASPAIDGVKDDAYAGPISIAAIFQNADGTNNTNPATGSAWIAWDDGALYYYVEIYDKTPNHNHPDAAQNVDNIELYIDWNNAKAAGLGAPLVENDAGYLAYEGDPGTDAAYPYWQVRIPAGPNADVDGEQNLGGAMWFDMGWGGVSWSSEEHTFFAGPLNGDYKTGYVVEIKVDSPVALTEGKLIGFDFGIGDNIEGEGRNGQIYLVESKANDQQWATPTACMGVLTLGAAYVAPAPEPEPEPEPEPAAPAEVVPAPAAPEPSAPKVGDSAIMLVILAVAMAGAFVIAKRVKN